MPFNFQEYFRVTADTWFSAYFKHGAVGLVAYDPSSLSILRQLCWESRTCGAVNCHDSVRASISWGNCVRAVV